jgi:hypothetical protein
MLCGLRRSSWKGKRQVWFGHCGLVASGFKDDTCFDLEISLPNSDLNCESDDSERPWNPLWVSLSIHLIGRSRNLDYRINFFIRPYQVITGKLGTGTFFRHKVPVPTYRRVAIVN